MHKGKCEYEGDIVHGVFNFFSPHSLPDFTKDDADDDDDEKKKSKRGEKSYFSAKQIQKAKVCVYVCFCSC